ncbi:MAG: DUF192 domain-containing protein [Selenomonadaceae bacterium]
MKQIVFAVNGAEFKVLLAMTFWQRLKGLLGTGSLPAEQGLLLPGCSSIHMFGMRYPLDIIYLDRAGTILKVVAELKPWQISGCWQAAAVLEVGSGTAARQGWQAGVRLEHLGYDAHKDAVEIKTEQRI